MTVGKTVKSIRTKRLCADITGRKTFSLRLPAALGGILCIQHGANDFFVQQHLGGVPAFIRR